MPQVYDDEKVKQLEEITGLNKADQKAMEARAQDSLDQQENAAASSDDSAIPYTSGDKPTGVKARLQKVTGFAKKHRKLVIIGGASAAFGGGLIGFFFYSSTLLLNTITDKIDVKQFSRIGRAISNNNENIMRLKLAMASTNDEEYQRALDVYKEDQPAGKFLRNLNKLRPAKVAENLLLGAEFETNETKIPFTNITRDRISAIIIDGQTIPIPDNQNSWGQKVRHPWQQMKSNFTAYGTALTVVGSQSGGGKITWRNFTFVMAATNEILRAKNISRYSWSKEKVAESLEEEANNETDRDEERVDATRDSHEKNQASNETTDPDAKQIVEQTNECVSNNECLQDMVENKSTISKETTADLNNKFSPSAIRSALTGLSATNTTIVVACLLASYTIQESQEAIDNNSNGATSSYFRASSGGDQLIYTQTHPGDPRSTASLTGGLNDQLNSDGSASNSIPFRRASGQEYTTATSPSPQSSVVGTYGTEPYGFAVAGGAEALSDATVTYGDGDSQTTVSLCDVANSLWTQGFILAGETAFNIFVPGGFGLSTAGRTGAALVATRILNGFLQTGKNLFSPFDLASIGATTTGVNPISNLTSALNMLKALQLAGAFFNGTAQGAEAINIADAGGNVLAQDVGRAMGAAPLTTEAYQEVETADTQFAYESQDQSVYNRYFAASNSNSLLNQVAFGVFSTLNLQSISSSFSQLVSSINPINLFSNISSLTTAGAAPGEDPELLMLEREYGITQWGWTNDEEGAFIGSDDYAPIYNESVLDQSGRRDELMEKYGKCFDAAGVSTGQLLADGDVFRDENANVDAEKGTCAPSRIGDSVVGDNKVSFKDEEAELVFRLRISIRNNLALDELLGVQDPVIVTPQE